MKFTVSSSALLALLAAEGKVIGNSRNTLPILNSFLMELRGGDLKVTATDLDTTLVGSLPVEAVEREGAVAAPSKLMLESLKEFSDIPLTIDVDDKTWEIRIEWATGSLSIPGDSPVGYPVMQQPGADRKELRMDVDLLMNGINKTIFATSDDEQRYPAMRGIYVALEEESITFVGTDSHKLVKYATETPAGMKASFILPKKSANLLRSMLVREEEPVEVVFDEKMASFALKSHTLICRLTEGAYPNYERVIPEDNPDKVLVDRIGLMNAIKRVSVCSSASTNLIRLEITENRIRLEAKDLDFSTSAYENIACSYEGGGVEVGFKSTYLVEILSNLETPTVLIELGDLSRAGVFKPVYDDRQNSTTLMLLMPMTIN